jgi:hypothetical protein
MTECPLCHEPVTDEQYTHPMMTLEGSGWAHRECLLRAVWGGIGHLEDHAHWCGRVGDPDGGRSYRQSALEVDAWVAAHG